MSSNPRTKLNLPKDDVVTRDTAIEVFARFLENLGYDAFIQSPVHTGRPWIVTMWANDQPDDRSCSAARSLHLALNDAIDQMKRPNDERRGQVVDEEEDDDEDEDDDEARGDY